MKNFGFKTALLLATLSIVFASLLLSNWLSYIHIKENTLTDIDQRTLTTVNYEANNIATWFQTKAHAIDVLAEDYKAGKLDKDYVPTLKLVKEISQLQDVIFGFDDATAYSAAIGTNDRWLNGVVRPGTYDPRGRPWYKKAKASSGLALTDIYTDTSSGSQVVSIVKNLGDGVVLGDITLSILADTVANISFPGAITAIIDQQGVTIASSSKALPVKTKLSEHGMAKLQSHMFNNKQGKFDYIANDIDKVAFTREVDLIEGNKWYLLVDIDKSIAYQAIDQALSRAVISSSIMLAIAAILVFVLLNTLYRPILTLKDLVVDLSKGNGDLTRRLPENRHDDLGQICAGINTFVADIQALMLEVSKASVDIAENVEQLTDQTKVNNDVLAQHSMETEQIVSAIEEMSVTADDVANNASQASKATHETSSQVDDSKSVLGDTINIISRLVNDVDTTSDRISLIGEDTQAISQVLNIIGEIAEQTNLLALNAAIEAARAGEQGRGFAVVADEVRALAARTQSSTAEISQTLDKLKLGSGGAIEAMKNTKDTCTKTASSASLVESDLDKIITSVVEVNDLNMQIATAAQQQSNVSREISRNTMAIREIVQQLSENSAVATEEIDELGRSNNQLKTMVAKFTLQ